jgi:hypothetical protein
VLSLGCYIKKQTLLKHPKMSSKDTVFYRANKEELLIYRFSYIDYQKFMLNPPECSYDPKNPIDPQLLTNWVHKIKRKNLTT